MVNENEGNKSGSYGNYFFYVRLKCIDFGVRWLGFKFYFYYLLIVDFG